MKFLVLSAHEEHLVQGTVNWKLTVVSFLPPLSSSLPFAADLPTCVVADGKMMFTSIFHCLFNLACARRLYSEPF